MDNQKIFQHLEINTPVNNLWVKENQKIHRTGQKLKYNKMCDLHLKQGLGGIL